MNSLSPPNADQLALLRNHPCATRTAPDPQPGPGLPNPNQVPDAQQERAAANACFQRTGRAPQFKNLGSASTVPIGRHLGLQLNMHRVCYSVDVVEIRDRLDRAVNCLV